MHCYSWSKTRLIFVSYRPAKSFLRKCCYFSHSYCPLTGGHGWGHLLLRRTSSSVLGKFCLEKNGTDIPIFYRRIVIIGEQVSINIPLAFCHPLYVMIYMRDEDRELEKNLKYLYHSSCNSTFFP